MPMYQSRCNKCYKIHDYYQSVKNYLDTPKCCGKKTEKVILQPPMASFDIQPWEAYESPATGKMITSKAQRREDFKASGCREWEGAEVERKYSTMAKKAEEQKQEKEIEETAKKTWAEFPKDKKDLLLGAL